MEKDHEKSSRVPFSGWFCVLFWSKKKKKKSDLFSPSLSFDRIREKEISDIHTEKFHPPTTRTKA